MRSGLLLSFPFTFFGEARRLIAGYRVGWYLYFGKQHIDPAQFAYGQRKEERKADNTVQYSREYIYLVFCYDISKGAAFRLQGLTYK